jgi:ABC-2 type transport system ATP-binding protein
MPAAIEVKGVHKAFRIPHEIHTTLTERLLHLFRQLEYERFEALRGVDLSIEHGSFAGIIGRNGSGKSTLLKLMAGLLPPDQGEIHVDGTMSALLELGLGFSPELTVRENVELYAALLGYPRREIHRRIDDAIHFAELERFRDAKLKNLSTGMRARLGFATALQAENDILLLDEILAVGDESFQRKCLDVFVDLKRRNKTIVLVTHDLNQVQLLCDQAFFVDAGRIAARGAPQEVVSHYLRSIAQEMPVPAEAENLTLEGAETAYSAADAYTDDRHIDRNLVRFESGWLEDRAGNRVDTAHCGDRLLLAVRATLLVDTEDPIFGLIVNEKGGQIVTLMSTRWLDVHVGSIRAGQTVEVRLPFHASLREGPYVANMLAADAAMTTLYGKTADFVEFVVRGRERTRLTEDLRSGFRCYVVEEPHPAAEETPAAVQRGGTR